MKKEKITTIEQLADVMQKGFDKIDTKFAGVNGQFKTVDQRFDVMEKRFNTMDQRFDAVDQKFNTMDQRFDVMEKRFNQKIEDEIEGLAIMTKKGFDEMDNRFATVNRNFINVTKQLNSIEKEIKDLKIRVSNLETRMTKLGGVTLEIKDEIMDIKKALENKIDGDEFVILENRVAKLELKAITI